MKFLKQFLFHRLGFFSLFLLIQLVILVAFIVEFNVYFASFFWVNVAISFVAALLIINNQSNPAYKIAWIIPILLFPIFGGLFYVFFGRHRLTKRQKHKLDPVKHETIFYLQEPTHLAQLETLDRTAYVQSRYINDKAFYPVYSHTSTKFFPLGDRMFDPYLKDLENAKKFIFLEYFIIQKGEFWNKILSILIQKVREGVDVRLIYDDFGSLSKLPFGYNKKLERKGIKTEIFGIVVPLFAPKFNNRDHRKMTIIDGNIAYSGGINLADEYINKVNRFGHWKDSAIRIEGQSVWNFTIMFLTLWNHLRLTDSDYTFFKPQLKESLPSNGFVQPFGDNPLDDEPVGENVYLNLINRATKYVYITTPYLIIDNEMITALINAAKNGIDVRIITPHIPDKRYAHSLTRSYYKVLVTGGVKIYEYTPGFVHAKNVIVDDTFGLISTINLDYRSLFLHFECGVWMYRTTALEEIKLDFLEMLELSMPIDQEFIKKVPWYKSLTRSLLRVFAPLM